MEILDIDQAEDMTTMLHTYLTLMGGVPDQYLLSHRTFLVLVLNGDAGSHAIVVR